MKSKIWLSPPHIGQAEQAFVADAFQTNWIAPLGPHVDGLEADICEFTGCGYAAALSSGTAALHLALILAGISTNDRVICQSFTFSATANPIIYAGAVPVFVDSEPQSWNICPIAAEQAICSSIAAGHKPKALIAVHLYGMPANIAALGQLCDKYEMVLIEDAAESLGATINGRQTGTFGHFGIFSFNGNKIITTSAGGALVSDNEQMIIKARFLATQARDPAPHYQHSQIGYNYRMSNICAAIGRGQMLVLEQRIAARRANFERYYGWLARFDGVGFQPEAQGSYANRWLSCITIDPHQTGGKSREELRLALEAENIEARPLWKPLHLQPIFAHYTYIGSKICENLFEHGLCLPSGSNLTDSEHERIQTVLFDFFK